MKRLLACLFFCAFAARLSAEEVRIGVLGLFHPRQIVVRKIAGQPLSCGVKGHQSLVENRFAMAIANETAARADRDAPPAYLCDNGSGGQTTFIISIPGKISRRYLGRAEFLRSSEQVLIVIAMQLETAVASVVAAESPAGAPLEALKAQAVAARSFLVAGKGRHTNFDFCDTTHCQFLRQPPALHSPAWQAAVQTRGMVLAYQDSVFPAMYSSSCGGRTHSLAELGIPVHGYPYFAVTCEYCRRHPQRWVAEISDRDAAALNMTESSRLKLARRLGWKAVPSNSYSSTEKNGFVVLEGSGIGHGIGLCQRGAADMARHGVPFREILSHYYPNASLRQL